MALIIGSGIKIGGNISITRELPPPPVFEYLFGDSKCYSGSGVDYGNASWNDGPSNYDQNYIFDLQADLQNATVGNYGYFNVDGGDGKPFYRNQGLASYFNFSPSDNTYIDCNPTGPVLPANSSYTIHAIIRINEFIDGGNPTASIIGGDNSSFGFLPQDALGTPYPILIAAAVNGPGPEFYAIDATTAFQPNQWYSVACVYNSQSQIMSLYVNGVKTAEQSGLVPFNSDEPLYIGTWEGYNWLNGSIGGITVWPRALPEEELLIYASTVSEPYLLTPIAISSSVFTEPNTYTYYVPYNVTSISAVGIGGGGGGTDTGYAYPGGDTVIYDQTNGVEVQASVGGTGTLITVDGTVYPDILGVDTTFVVRGTDIDNASTTYPGFAKVTYVNNSTPSAVLIYINKTIDINVGDYFDFYPCIVYAEGAYEINDSVYNNGFNGPGPRAMPRIGDGGGRGGVVDYIDSWPIGGAGAGGYGLYTIQLAADLVTPKVNFDKNQTFLYTQNNDDEATGTPGIVCILSNNDLTVTAIGNTSLGYNATGTYPIKPNDLVMFSLNVDTDPGSDTIGVGFCNYSADIMNYTGGDDNSVSFFNSGNQYWQNNAQSTGLPTFTTGDTVDIAINQAAGCIWYRVNGGDWNGDPMASPTDFLTGKSLFISGNDQDPNLYLAVCAGYNTDYGAWSINTNSAYSVPSGYTFVGGAGMGDAGASGGDGTSDAIPTMKPGQNSSGAGGSGRIYDTGAGGGGTGIYGAGSPGGTGVWANQNALDNNFLIPIGSGGGGGSTYDWTGSDGGLATSWLGGRGGYPGGGGGSGVGYYMGANGGALAYKNNYPVTPFQQLTVVVGIGGQGEQSGGAGAPGMARIVYPGDSRSFPNTMVNYDESSFSFDPAYTILNDLEPPFGVSNVLSGSNRTITAVAPVNVMGTPTQTTALTRSPIRWGDKVMFSVRLNVMVGDGNGTWNGIGVTGQGQTLTSYLGQGAENNGVAFYESGAYFGNLNGLENPPTFTQSDIIDVAVDYFNGLIYMRVNGGNWNNNPLADPSTNQGGYLLNLSGNVALNSGPLYPAVTPYYDTGTSTGNEFILQNTPVYSVPGGYTYIGT